MTRKVMSFFFILCLFLFSHAHAAYRDYLSDQGTFPDAQGWSLYDTDPDTPDYTLVGNNLHQGPTLTAPYQYWYRNDLPLDFTTGSAVFQWSVDILLSRTIRSDRAGFNVQVQDYQGYMFNLWFGENSIFIHNDPNNGGVQTYTFDTSGFHTYRFEVDGSLGSLFIDGNSTAAIVIPVGSLTSTSYNRVAFGDGSKLARNESLTDYFFYADDVSANPVPIPAAFWLFASGLTGLISLRASRRKRTK